MKFKILQKSKCEPEENILREQECATDKVQPMEIDEMSTNKTTEETNISKQSNSQSIHLSDILISDSETQCDLISYS